METTYADGGSARSQAADLGDRWHARPWAARGLRLLVFLAPIAVSLLVTRAYVLSVPVEPFGSIAYWGGMLLVAILTSIVVERWAHTLLPLVAMFRLSLAFPDEAPSRYRVALRAGSTKKITARAIADGDAGPAAELLAVIQRLSHHDPQTRGHSERVRAYADLIAEQLGLAQADRDRLAWGALAHDVGKLEVRGEVLRKQGRPNAEEWAEIRGHPAAAVEHLEPVLDWLGPWAFAATEHHERWDGAGYPLGRAGTDISLAGRIVAVADAFDVMTSARSYKPALTPQAARAEITRNAGTQFDPAVVRALLGVSLGRLRIVLGPMAWLGEIAWVARIPQSISTAGAVAASATVATVATLVAPVTEGSDEVAGLERVAVVEAEPTASQPPPLAEPAPGSDPVTPDTTTSVSPSTTTPPPGPSTTAAPTTTTTPSTAPTTTAEPTSTSTSTSSSTTSTTTTSTTTTTTTVAPSSSDLSSPQFLVGTAGAAQAFLALDGPLADGPLANYDTNRDDDLGLLLRRGSGLDETDSKRRQRFWTASEDGLQLSGTPRLQIWAAAENFDQSKVGEVLVGVFDCNESRNHCTLLTSGSSGFDQSSFGADFGLVTVTMASLDGEIAAGRTLVVTVVVGTSSETDLWLAYGTTSYAANFVLLD